MIVSSILSSICLFYPFAAYFYVFEQLLVTNSALDLTCSLYHNINKNNISQNIF